MNDYDRILFEQLTKEYKQNNLSNKELEDLYQRFLSIDHLSEVQPYLIAMRYLGLGTPKDKNVLIELKGMIGKNDYILAGLYYDLYLIEKNNSKAYERLLQMQKRGYSDVYLNQYSHLPKKIIPKEELYHFSCFMFETKSPNSKWKDSTFQGFDFTSNDITYLSAYLFIESDVDNVEIKTSSQIYMDGKPFSEVMHDDFTLEKRMNVFVTSGFGNKSGGFFKAGHDYEWKVIIDDKIYSDKFNVHPGSIDTKGVLFKQRKLYECKSNTKFNQPVSKFSTTFNSSTLLQVNLRCYIEPPRETKYIRPHITFYKLGNLENTKEIAYVIELKPDQHFFDLTLEGYDEPGRWRKGTYYYSISFDTGKTYEGKFDVI